MTKLRTEITMKERESKKKKRKKKSYLSGVFNISEKYQTSTEYLPNRTSL